MKLDELLVANTTRQLLASYVQQPKQGVLLSGPKGTGLHTIAQSLAISSTSHSSHIMFVEPDEKGTISIERVRALYVETRSVRAERFVIIIDDVDSMSHDAQNSFLKLLEEPVENVHFILTTHEPQLLLPTILSRVQTIEVGVVSRTQSESLLRSRHVTDATKLQQMLFIASGRPAELVRLAENAEYFEKEAERVRLARDFLKAGSHERLIIISRVSGRDDAQAFVAVIAAVLGFTAQQNKASISPKTVEVLETVAARLHANGHVRTQLMYLALNT